MGFIRTLKAILGESLASLSPWRATAARVGSAFSPRRGARVARPRVEPLEPRWLLSGTLGDESLARLSDHDPVLGTELDAPVQAPVSDFGHLSGGTRMPIEAASRARPLPVSLFQTIAGEVGPSNPSMTYRVPIGPETAGMIVRLRQPEAGRPLLADLAMYDEDGNPDMVVGPTQGTTALWLHWRPTPGDDGRLPRAVYLQVRFNLDGLGVVDDSGLDLPLADQSGGAFPGGRFLLEIEREWNASLDLGAGGAPGSSSLDPGPAAPRPPWAPPILESKAEVLATERLRGGTVDAPVVLGLPTGPLPLMAAGPFGGILSNKASAPVEDPRDPATTDLVLNQRPAQAPRSRASAQSEAGNSDALDDESTILDDPALAEVRAAGAFPLLGSSARGTPTRKGLATPTLASMARHTPPPPPPPDVRIEARGAGEAPESERIRAERSRTLRRLSVTSATLVALLATLSPHLPGLIEPIRIRTDSMRRRGAKRAEGEV
ncbi:MAG: hypothetical protein AB7I30_06700 [Isosphaeraceae bacterium]